MVNSTPTKTQPITEYWRTFLTIAYVPGPESRTVQGQTFNNSIGAIPHQQMMANGYAPFNGFHSENQGQYILQHQYQLQQQQQQQQMYMMYHQMQQQYQGNFATNHAPPPNQKPDQQNRKSKVSNTETNRRECETERNYILSYS